MERDIREVLARDKWDFARRAWRMDGKPQMTCRQVLERYCPRAETIPVGNEIGVYESTRFIMSEGPGG
jgi:hypothetical protein